MLPNFECLIVKKPTYLSDHSQVVAWLKPQVEAEPDTNHAVFSDKLLLKLPVQFMWEKDSFNLFNLALKSADIQRQVLEFTEYKFLKSIDGVEKAVKMVENILTSAALKSLKRKRIKHRRKPFKNANKKWFDKECRLKRHEVRKRSNIKHDNPMDCAVREEYHSILKEYKTLLKSKRKAYRDQKLRDLESTDSNPELFGKILNIIPDNVTEKVLPPVPPAMWMKHFNNLHQSPSANNHTNTNVLEKLTRLEESVMERNEFDFDISDKEILDSTKKLKNKKSSYFDLMKNEIIKTRSKPLIEVYSKLFNHILSSGIFPNTLCKGLKTPIRKSGEKTNQENYRGVRVSSCLGKLFVSFCSKEFLTSHPKKKSYIHPKLAFLVKTEPVIMYSLSAH